MSKRKTGLQKAIELAVKVHSGGDRTGYPYITHPLRVMEKLTGNSEKIVAILHDIVEDTPTTLEDLDQMGFAQNVVEAVKAMTHLDEDSYMDYVIKIKSNSIARKVKLADLEDNFNLPRTLMRPARLEGDLDRLRRYALSWRFLQDKITEEEYRQAMNVTISAKNN